MPDEPEQPEAHNPRNEKPLSLHPLSVEEALQKALGAKPAQDDKDHGQKPKPKK